MPAERWVHLARDHHGVVHGASGGNQLGQCWCGWPPAGTRLTDGPTAIWSGPASEVTCVECISVQATGATCPPPRPETTMPAERGRSVSGSTAASQAARTGPSPVGRSEYEQLLDALTIAVNQCDGYANQGAVFGIAHRLYQAGIDAERQRHSGCYTDHSFACQMRDAAPEDAP